MTFQDHRRKQKAFYLFEQGGLPLHIAVGPTNYAAGPAHTFPFVLIIAKTAVLRMKTNISLIRQEYLPIKSS